MSTAKETTMERNLDLFKVTLPDAQARFDKALFHGKERVELLLDRVLGMRIHDELCEHPDLADRVLPPLAGPPAVLELRGPGGAFYALHRNAALQLCGRVKLPVSYVDYLCQAGKWGGEIAAENLRLLLRDTPFAPQDGRPRRFLLRFEGHQLKAFLTRSYGIHLATNPLLPRFLDDCAAQRAVPIDCTASDVRVSVTCALPYVQEVSPGQYLALGLSFHNSDFGAGKFSLRETIWDPVHDRGIILGEATATLLDKQMHDRVHLGPRLNDADLLPSNNARARRTEMAAAYMRRTVGTMFSPDWIQALCRLIQRAQEQEISWGLLLKTSGALLLKEEVTALKAMLEGMDIRLPLLQRDPDGLPIPTKWWGASALSFLAAQLTDPTRKMDLQEEAGKFLKV